MVTPITIKIHADLLKRIEAVKRKSSMSRHRTILSTIDLGLRHGALKRQMYEQQVAYGKSIRDTKKRGIIIGICYSISCVSAICIVAFIFLHVT